MTCQQVQSYRKLCQEPAQVHMNLHDMVQDKTMQYYGKVDVYQPFKFNY